MADDAGDAAAQETQQTISQAISMLIYRAGMGSMRNAGKAMQGPRIMEKIEAAFGKALAPGGETSKGARPDTAGAAESSADPAREAEARPDDLEVVVDNEEDFDFIKGVLDDNNVEYSVSREYAEDATWSLANRSYSEGAQIAVFKLPDRDVSPKLSIHAPFSRTDHVIVPSGHPWTPLEELDPEVVGLLGTFSREAIDAKLALRLAADQIGFDGALDELPAFEPGKQGNLSLDFTTVKWDPEALIMSDPLDRMGVPYEKHLGDGIARFEFSAAAAPAVKAVADWHLGHAESKIGKSRFPDYGRLEAAVENGGARSELVEVTVKDARAAALLKEELKDRGVAFESIYSKATREETFLARAEEIRAKAPELEQLKRDCDSGRSEGRAAELMHRRENQIARNAKAASESASVEARPRSESKVSANRAQTPSRDQSLARKSVAARRASRSRSLKKTASRGR